MAEDGGLLISEFGKHRVIHVDTEGTVREIFGTGDKTYSAFLNKRGGRGPPTGNDGHSSASHAIGDWSFDVAVLRTDGECSVAVSRASVGGLDV